MRTTALVPLPRGAQFDVRLPDVMPSIVVEHGKDGRHEAISTAARRAESEFVIVVEPDAGLQPHALTELEMVAWDADGVYPSLTFCDPEFKPKRQKTAEPFCPNRLLKENYVGPTALIRREALLSLGGWGGAWQTWLALGPLKPAAQAHYLLRTPPLGDPPPTISKPPFEAVFYCQGTPATAYVRCQLPARHLPGYVQLYFPKTRTNEDGDYYFVDHEGAAVFQYPGDRFRQLVIAGMQEKGIRVLVEVDDNYLAMDSRWAKRAGWTLKGEGDHTVERHRRIASEADGVIVTSEHLYRSYRKVNPNVYVCPNQVEPGDWPERTEDDGILRIGWFASMSHREDGHLIAAALEWAGRQEGVEVWLMGAGAERTLHLNDVGEVISHDLSIWPELRRVRLHHIPATNDLSTYRTHMTRLDVGLAPVKRSLSSDARSDLKAIEYGMAGAFPVLSDVPPYANWIDGDLCRKATTGKEFLHAVQDLVRNRDETKRLARELREHVRSERSVKANIELWREATAA